MMLAAVDRSDVAKRLTALADARAARADEPSFKEYSKQLKQVSRD